MGLNGDPRVRPLLDEIGWKFEIDSDGDYKLAFRYEDGRTHLVFINSNTSNLGQLEIRQIYAAGLRSSSPFDQQVLNHFLEQNDRVKIGAWRVQKTREGYFAVFVAQLSADTDVDTLKTVVEVIGRTADETEKKMAGNDAL